MHECVSLKSLSRLTKKIQVLFTLTQLFCTCAASEMSLELLALAVFYSHSSGRVLPSPTGLGQVWWSSVHGRGTRARFGRHQSCRNWGLFRFQIQMI